MSLAVEHLAKNTRKSQRKRNHLSYCNKNEDFKIPNPYRQAHA